jgi:hypothetical protein
MMRNNNVELSAEWAQIVLSSTSEYNGLNFEQLANSKNELSKL